MIKVQSLQWKDASTALKIYFVSITFMAAIPLRFLLINSTFYDWLFFLPWAILMVVAGVFSVDVKQTQTRISMEIMIIFALTILFDPAVSAWMVLFGVMVDDGVFGRRSILTTSFNMAQCVLAAGVSGLVYMFTGGPLALFLHPQGFTMSLSLLIPFLLYVVTFLSINLVTAGIAIQLSTGMPWRKVWNFHFGRLIVTHVVVITPLVLFMVYLQLKVWIWAGFLCLLPLLFINVSTKKYFKDKQVTQDQT